MILYNYQDVYIKDCNKSYWYIPYIGPETRSEDDIPQFIQLSKRVMNDYSNSKIHKLGRGSLKDFEENEKITHPCTLMIWRDDVDDINKRALQISSSTSSDESCIIF